MAETMHSTRQAEARRIRPFDRLAIWKVERERNGEEKQVRSARAGNVVGALHSVRLVQKFADPRYAVDAKEQVEALKADEERLMSEVPESMTPRRTAKTPRGVTSESRIRQLMQNDAYVSSTPRRSQGESPDHYVARDRAWVERNKPLPVRVDITKTKAGQQAQPRYLVASLYEPGSRRQEIQEAKEAKLAKRQHAPRSARAQYTPREHVLVKRPKDWVPRVASCLPADHGLNKRPAAGPGAFRKMAMA